MKFFADTAEIADIKELAATGLAAWWVVTRWTGSPRAGLVAGALFVLPSYHEGLPIAALEAHPAGAKIVLHTDSTYVKDGLTKWIINWKRNGWKNAAKEPVKNKDLWVRLEAAAASHKVDWRWVKGHSGHKENDRADALARLGCDENKGRR